MATILTKESRPAVKPPPSVPRQPMTAAQQAEALRRTHAQAEQRVKLGVELFKAAEKRLTTQADTLRQVRNEQKELREAVQHDVARSLQSYDQWIGRIDEGFTKALRALEDKVDAMSAEWSRSQKRIEEMVARSEQLLAQSRMMLDEQTTERTPPQPLKFHPGDVSGSDASGPDDEKLYSLILDKLRHDESA